MELENKFPRQNNQYTLQQMDDESLLYNPVHTKTIYLNASAAVIWQMCDGELSVGQIIKLLAEEFPESQAQIRGDVLQSIDELVQNQAIFLDS